jgi:hypothetical protein
MAKADPLTQSTLAQAVAALLMRTEPEDLAQRVGLVAGATGGWAPCPAPLAGLAPLVLATRPLPARCSEQQLADLLKMPGCRRPARDVILRQLGQQCGQPFANTWEFAAWARDHRPDLDLTTPPRRPGEAPR